MIYDDDFSFPATRAEAVSLLAVVLMAWLFLVLGWVDRQMFGDEE